MRIQMYVDDPTLWLAHQNADPRFLKVHLIGHSEGASVGMLAAQNSIVSRFISIAEMGQRYSDLTREQLKTKISGEMMQQSETILRKREAGELVADVPVELIVLFRPSAQPYLISCFQLDPLHEFANRKNTPVLIVRVSTDIQWSKEDATRLAGALSSAEKRLLQK